MRARRLFSLKDMTIEAMKVRRDAEVVALAASALPRGQADMPASGSDIHFLEEWAEHITGASKAAPLRAVECTSRKSRTIVTGGMARCPISTELQFAQRHDKK